MTHYGRKALRRCPESEVRHRTEGAEVLRGLPGQSPAEPLLWTEERRISAASSSSLIAVTKLPK